jgi:hypothetical protein
MPDDSREDQLATLDGPPGQVRSQVGDDRLDFR